MAIQIPIAKSFTNAVNRAKDDGVLTSDDVSKFAKAARRELHKASVAGNEAAVAHAYADDFQAALSKLPDADSPKTQEMLDNFKAELQLREQAAKAATALAALQEKSPEKFSGPLAAIGKGTEAAGAYGKNAKYVPTLKVTIKDGTAWEDWKKVPAELTKLIESEPSLKPYAGLFKSYYFFSPVAGAASFFPDGSSNN